MAEVAKAGRARRVQLTVQPSQSPSLHGYRNARVRALCGVCRGVAETHCCPRCHAPLCGEHALQAGARCGACEATYAELRDDRRREPVPAVAAALSIIAGVVVCGFAVPWVMRAASEDLAPWLALALVAVAGTGPLTIALYRRGRLRGTFLRETPTSRRLVPRAPLVDPRKPHEAAPLPPENISLAALVLVSVFFFLPGTPVVALVLASLGYARRRWCGRGGKNYVLAAVVVSLLVGVLQLFLFLV